MKNVLFVHFIEIIFYFLLDSYLLARAIIDNSDVFISIFSCLLIFIPLLPLASYKKKTGREYIFLCFHLLFSILITEYILREVTDSGQQLYLWSFMIAQIFSIDNIYNSKIVFLIKVMFYLYFSLRFWQISADQFIQFVIIILASAVQNFHFRDFDKMEEKRNKSENNLKQQMVKYFLEFYPMFTILLKQNGGKKISHSHEFPYELCFVNEYAKNEYGVKDIQALLKIFENIKLNSNDILNSDQSPNYSPHLKSRNFGNLSNYLNNLKEDQIKIFPLYQKFLVTFSNPIQTFENFNLKPNITQNQFRIILILFKCKEETFILVNMENSYLEDQLKKFKQMDFFKDQMLASITHDLKSPLSSVLTLIDTAKNLKDNEERQKQLDYAIHNGNMLLHQINEILDYSQMKMGKFNIFYSNFSLNQLLDDVYKLMKIQSDLKKVELRIENKCKKEKNPIFFSDYRRLKQVLINLIGNSLKFTSVGKIVIKISEIKVSNIIKFEVVDTGAGIKEETLKKLGKPFNSYGHENDIKYEGFGLGLFNCQTIVGQLGPYEKLYISSRYGSGSKFGFLVYLVCDKKTQKFSTAGQLEDIKKKNPLFFSNLNNKIESNWLDEEFSAFYSKEFCSNDFDEKKSLNETNLYQFSKKMIPNSLTSLLSSTKMLLQKENNKESIDLNLKNLRSPERKKSNFFLQNKDIKYMQLPPRASSLNEIIFKKKLPKIHLLLIDDDIFNLLVFKAYIKQFLNENPFVDIEFNEASDGMKAVELFRKNNHKNSPNPYEIIFLDCNMPIMNGFDAASAIKKAVEEEHFIDSLIVGCSALPADKTDSKCFQFGMNLFIEKPIKYEVFRDILLKQRKK